MSTPEMEMAAYSVWYRGYFQRRWGRLPSDETVRSVLSRLGRCVSLAGETSVESFGTHLQERIYTDRLLDRLHANLTPGGVRNVVNVLSVFGRYAVAMGWAESVALSGEDRPPANPQKQIEVFTSDELAIILRTAYVRDQRFGLMLDTLATTGRRIGETLQLKWEDLRLIDPVPHYRVSPEVAKTNQEALVPLNRHLVSQFTELRPTLQGRQHGTRNDYGRDADVYIFPFRYGNARQLLERHLQRLGLPHRGLHAFRHTRATQLLAAGVPPQAVAALLGHSVTTLMKVYSHATGLTYAQYLED